MKILFICLGNICRSPTAEGVFAGFVKKEGLCSVVEIDSAGTSGCHVGEKADTRMIEHARARGYELTSRSRKFEAKKDFDYFDMIIVMDGSNKKDILELDFEGKFHDKISMMTDYCSFHDEEKVPDPYYGGAEGFQKVIDIIEDASQGLIDVIKKRL